MMIDEKRLWRHATTLLIDVPFPGFKCRYTVRKSSSVQQKNLEEYRIRPSRRINETKVSHYLFRGSLPI